MNRKEMEKKIQCAIDSQIYERGYATCIDTLLKMEWITKKNEQAWRKGQIPYLERAIVINLSKSKYFLDCYRSYAVLKGYKLNWTCYKLIGCKNLLKFTRTGQPELEKLFSSHIVCMEKKGEKSCKSS